MSRLGRVPAILRSRGIQVSGDTLQELEAFETALADEIEKTTRQRGTTRTHW